MPQDSDGQSSSPVHSEAVGQRPMRIILAEDSPGDAILTKKSLDRTGIPYTLSTLRKGAELLSTLHELMNAGDSPDLILLDLGLPGINGFDVLETLAGSHPRMRQTPIIILTGMEHFDYIAKTNKMSIVAYLQKPCNAGKLRDLMLRINKNR